MFRNRKWFLSALTVLVIMFTMIAPAGIQPAHAVTILEAVGVTCDPVDAVFDPANTEGTVSQNIKNKIATQTEGVTLDKANSGLFYWDKKNKQIYGIGDGSKIIDPSVQYYLTATFDLNSASYDWPDKVKATSDTQDYQAKDFPLAVYLNGADHTGDAWFRYNPYWNSVKVLIPFGPDMSSCKGALSADSFIYDGTAKKPDIASLTLYDKAVQKECYTFTYTDSNGNAVASPVNAGAYFAVLKGEGMYTGAFKLPFTIVKAANPMSAVGKIVTIRASKLAKKKQVIKLRKAFTVTGAVGNVTFQKVSGNKKISVSSDGKITVKKGLKSGKYKVKVMVTAAGDVNTEPLSTQVTVTLKIKK